MHNNERSQLQCQCNLNKQNTAEHSIPYIEFRAMPSHEVRLGGVASCGVEICTWVSSSMSADHSSTRGDKVIVCKNMCTSCDGQAAEG
jgi:hypothetical protein